MFSDSAKRMEQRPHDWDGVAIPPLLFASTDLADRPSKVGARFAGPGKIAAMVSILATADRLADHGDDAREHRIRANLFQRHR
jgi:hypothetical protein